MQQAVPVGEGAMAALIGVDYETAKAIAAQAQQEAGADMVCAVANDNGGGQVVISGSKPAVDRAIDIAKTKGIRRAIVLPVSAPFHCALMQPAAEVDGGGFGEGRNQAAESAARRQCRGRAGRMTRRRSASGSSNR